MTASSSPLPTTTTQILLARRPTGAPVLEDFRVAEAPLAPLADDVLGGHVVHTVRPVMGAYAPAVQRAQALAFAAPENLPDAHAPHTVTPSPVEKLPAAHRVHVVEAEAEA